MSGSLSTELSYEGPLLGSPQGDTPNSPDEPIPARRAEQPPDLYSPHAPDTRPDTQPDNRLSVVSAVSLEPRRRSRHHHHSRHSHLHRELAHMLSISSRDAKELRLGLNSAFEKLDQSRARASHAEKLALDVLLRVRRAEEERTNAMREASSVREELGKYKALVDNAHGEIRRAQQMLQDQDHLRYEAEASAARARDNARQMKQRRLIDLAREEGRKMGYREGIQAGQNIGYHEGPVEDGRSYPNERPRFREIFDESKYQLDEFDQSLPLRDTYLNPPSLHDTEALLAAPLPRREVYPRLQEQFNEPPGPANDSTNLPPEASYTPMTPSRGSSTHLRQIRPVQQPSLLSLLLLSNPTGVLPSVVPFSQGGPGFEPPPGNVEEPPSGLVSRYPAESGGPVYESPSPRRAFDLAIPNSGMTPDVSRSPVQENFSTATGMIQSPSREHYETLPGDISNPAQERSTTTHFPGATRIPTDGAPFVNEPRNPEFPGRPGSRPLVDDPRNPEFSGRPRGRPPVEEPRNTEFSGRPSSRPIVDDPRNREFSGRPSSRPVIVDDPRNLEFSGRPSSRPIVDDPRNREFSRPNSRSLSYEPRNPELSGRPSSRPIVDDTRNREFLVPDSRSVCSLGPAFGVPPLLTMTSLHMTDGTQSSQRGLVADHTPSQSAKGGLSPRRDGPPKRRPIPRMPAPLAPQSKPNALYAHGSHPTVPRRQASESYDEMPRDAGQDANSNGAHDMYSPSSSPVIPSSAELPTDRVREQRTYTMSPRSTNEQLRDPGTSHDPRPETTLQFLPSDSLADQPTVSQNLPPRVHVQIPPTRYHAPNSASPPLATTPVTQIHVPPADMYSPRATSPNTNVEHHSPRRYPPTLYNEPNLQRHPTSTGDYEQEGRTATPYYLGGPLAAEQRTANTPPRTLTDTLPIRPPSVSPRPSPAVFSHPSQGAATSPSPRRPASPNPLPRGASPAPLFRASSPAPLPIRSPSVRSAHMGRSPSDVSLPGAPGSPYMRYNPNLEADIAVLASSSVDRLTAPGR
ncbi:hypothetical protein BJV74DRAFT_880903 [Russula compacta]|nr:hypothetical protein BJV74DRAFT_880903 [Russula compacta]